MPWLALIAVVVVLTIGFLRLSRVGGWAALRQHPNDLALRRRRRRSSWGTIAAMLLLGSWFIFAGSYLLRIQHYGVPARITVERCAHNSRRVTGCSGQWRPSADAPTKWVNIWFTNDKDVGHEVDVHIRGRRAIPDSSIAPPIGFGLGATLVVAAIIGVVHLLLTGRA